MLQKIVSELRKRFLWSILFIIQAPRKGVRSDALFVTLRRS